MIKYLDYNRRIDKAAPIYGAADMKQLYADLKEHSVYLVAVAFNEGNPVHEAILLTGFNSGSYWQLCCTGYEHPIAMNRVHVLQVKKELHTFEKGKAGVGKKPNGI